jgi:hypothetical protein
MTCAVPRFDPHKEEKERNTPRFDPNDRHLKRRDQEACIVLSSAIVPNMKYVYMYKVGMNLNGVLLEV